MSDSGMSARGDGLDPLTRHRLEIFVQLLRKWTTKINLIAPSTVDLIWTRHIADSLQLFGFRDGTARSWADLGTGGGFPGAVIALAAAQSAPDLHVTLVEADQRKAAFLRNVSRETGVPMTVIADRIEAIPPLGADVVSARALAPLPQLCAYAKRHLAAGGTALFHKGAGGDAEVDVARRSWAFDLTEFPSQTDSGGKILRLKDLAHV